MTFVEPAYGGRSLGDVLPAVSRALEVDAGLPETTLELPEARAYVVFLIDGLGYELLRDHPDQAPFLHELLDGQPAATVGVPSTTATSLTSLGTGLLTADDFSLRVSAAAEGPEAVANLLGFADALSARTAG